MSADDAGGALPPRMRVRAVLLSAPFPALTTRNALPYILARLQLPLAIDLAPPLSPGVGTTTPGVADAPGILSGGFQDVRLVRYRCSRLFVPRELRGLAKPVPLISGLPPAPTPFVSAKAAPPPKNEAFSLYFLERVLNPEGPLFYMFFRIDVEIRQTLVGVRTNVGRAVGKPEQHIL